MVDNHAVKLSPGLQPLKIGHVLRNRRKNLLDHVGRVFRLSDPICGTSGTPPDHINRPVVARLPVAGL